MSFKSILSGTALALSFATTAMAEVEIHDAYARSSNPMAGAAFMVIHNHGDTDDRLIGVRSDVAARTELHTHRETENGVMQMIHVEDGYDFPAGAEIIMQRGSDHVMFMGLNNAFEDGETISITLIFEQAGEIDVDITIDQTRTPMDHGEMDHGEMDHSEMDHGSDG